MSKCLICPAPVSKRSLVYLPLEGTAIADSPPGPRENAELAICGISMIAAWSLCVKLPPLEVEHSLCDPSQQAPDTPSPKLPSPPGPPGGGALTLVLETHCKTDFGSCLG